MGSTSEAPERDGAGGFRISEAVEGRLTVFANAIEEWTMDEQQHEHDELRGGIKHQGGGTQIVVAAAAYDMGSYLMVPAQQVDQSSTSIVVADLPAADPHRKGQLWSNAGVVTISAG